MPSTIRETRASVSETAHRRHPSLTCLRRALAPLAILFVGGGILSCGKPAEPPATGPTSAATGPASAPVAVSVPAAAAEPPPAPPGRDAEPAPRSLTTAQIVARVDPSVALIRGKRALGTGFLVQPGLLATNAHVIEGEVIKNLEIRFPSAGDNRKGPMNAELAFKDPKRDLAFLRVQTDLPPLEIAEAYEYQKGTTCWSSATRGSAPSSFWRTRSAGA